MHLLTHLSSLTLFFQIIKPQHIEVNNLVKDQELRSGRGGK